MKKRVLALVLVSMLVLSVFLTGCGGGAEDTEVAEDVYVLKIAHIVSEADDVHIGFQKFKEDIEAASDGRIAVEIYGNRILANSDIELAELVNTDTVQMACVAVFNLPVAYSELTPLSIFDFPYMFMTKEEQGAYANSEEGLMLFEQVLEVSGNTAVHGCYPRSWLNWGFVDEINPKTPADVKGLNVRTNSADVLASCVAALGANPTMIAFSETYTALQQGALQGVVQSTNHFVSENTFEVIKTFVDLKSSCMLNTTLISNSWVESLPADLQQVFMDSFYDYNDYMIELSNTTEERSKETLVEKGVNVIEPSEEEMVPWIEAGKSIWDEKASLVGGKDVVDRANAWVEAYREQ